MISVVSNKQDVKKAEYDIKYIQNIQLSDLSKSMVHTAAVKFVSSYEKWRTHTYMNTTHTHLLQ